MEGASFVASLASESAHSFPRMSECPGHHWKTIWRSGCRSSRDTSLDLLPLPSAFGRALAPTAECHTEASLHPQATNQPTFQPVPRRQQQQLPEAPHHQQPQANWHHQLISMAMSPPSPPPTHLSHPMMATQRWLAHLKPAKRGQQKHCPQLPNILPPLNHSQTLRRNS